MRAAIIGANGQLGSDLAAAFMAAGDVVTGLNHSELDISSLESVQESLAKIKPRPEVVVNTAAFHQVEECEAHPAQAFAVNGLGPRNLAQVTKSLDAALVHISTDYVFDGQRKAPYIEEDPALPLNVYGNTKLCGENFARSINPCHFVVRVAGLYGLNPCRAKKGGLNFVELMLKLSTERPEVRVVDDEFTTPTSTAEVARQLVALSRTSEYGLYHATAEGSCSWYEFARAIFELTGTRVRLEPARPGDFPANVPRPKYSVLENQALKKKSLNLFRPWKEGLAAYLESRQRRKV